MSITINQTPLNYTPSNGQHIYNAESNLSGQTSFRYVFDVWMNPFNNAERVARVKVAPNSSGVGIVDVGDIVKNYVKANTRTDLKQVSSSTFQISTYSNPNGQIPFAETTLIPSNEFNDNPTYPYLPHVTEYRVLVGEEYITGGTLVLNICTEPYQVGSTFGYELTDGPASYTGSPNTIVISNAGASIPDYADPSLFGWRYLHTTLTGTFVASGTTSAQTGSYSAISVPTSDDILTITENYSGCRFTFRWFEEAGVFGWYYQSQFCPSCVNNDTDVITIWPGVQQNKKIYNYQNSWWGNNNTNGENNHQWWDLYRYKWQTNTSISGDTPAQFLTTFGDEYYTTTFVNAGTPTTLRTRKRSHHFECPIILSYFHRDFNESPLASNQTPVFFNDPSTQTTTLTFAGTLTGTTLTSTTTNNRIVYDVIKNVIPNRTYGFFKTTGTTSNTAGVETNRISEAVVFQLYGDECLSDPQHFLFLNQQGVWDTWTFDRKNIKTYNKDNQVYAQGLIRDNSIYNPLFNQQRNIIFDQTITEVVEAQSHYMNENDRKIVEELFLSTHVYLMTDFYDEYDAGANDQYTKTPHLIPISITSNSIQEYKQRYNKVFQYTLTYEYNPIQQFRSNL